MPFARCRRDSVVVTTSSATPQWLLRPEAALCPCGCIGRRRKGSFVEKTLAGATGVLQATMFSEDVAGGGGLLQRLDPRVKVVSLFGLLVVAAFVRHIPVLIAMYAGTLVLAAASKIPVSWFVKRVWLFIPLFTGVIVLPATLNVITHGRIVVSLGTWFGVRLGLTAQGLTSAGLIVSRVATSISLVVLVTITTPWAKLLAALRSLYVARMLILVLGLAYRYIFHLLASVTDMYTARKSRTVTREAGVASGRRFVATSAGALFGKAQALSEEVHMAMIARGYTGDARTINAFRVRVSDVMFGLAALATAIVVIGVDRVPGR
jgi:cobalt/nickel transport system permease protein